MTKKSLVDNLAPLAKASVPILHVCGRLDPLLKDQTRVVEKRFQELGGNMTVIVKEGAGHFLPATMDQGPIVDFIVRYPPKKSGG
jgi:pimeloyl-ACP methyl ester carboxylesterase